MSVFLLVCLIFLYHCLFHVSFFPYLFIARSFGQFVTERQSNLNCIYLYFRLIDDLLLLLRRGHAQELHQYSQVKTNSTGRLMVYCILNRLFTPIQLKIYRQKLRKKYNNIFLVVFCSCENLAAFAGQSPFSS